MAHDRRLDFKRQLDHFSDEVNGATQYFYAYLGLHHAMYLNPQVEDLVNEANLFWRTTLNALQVSTFITLNRIFDDGPDVRFSVALLLKAGSSNIEQFSRKALAERKRHDAGGDFEWIKSYAASAYVATVDDFRRLRKQTAKWRRLYETKYKPIRTKYYAHSLTATSEERDRLFGDTRVGEIQKILRFLRLEEALRELWNNGRKPVLRTQRYSVPRIKGKPKAFNAHVHEWMTHEIVDFLDLCAAKVYADRGSQGLRRRRPKRSTR